MPTIPNKPLEAETKELSYQNLSASGGVNERLSGRMLAEDEATSLINVDISVPGKRTKRLEPLTIAELGNAPSSGGYPVGVFGMAPFVISGTAYILAASAGHIYLVDGISHPGESPVLTGPQINANSYVNFVMANGVQYFVDGLGNLFSTNGTTITPIVLLDASNNQITDIEDFVWFMNRMWYVSGDFLYFSSVNNPISITDSAINIALGDGGVLKRVLPYRDGLLILFKFGVDGGQGSIHLCDVSDGVPADFQLNTQPFFDHLNLCSPRCVNRMGFDVNAEIVFATVEGLRSDQFTALDRLVTPSLPFSQNIPDSVGTINQVAIDSAFTVVWNDELLWGVPVNGSFIPNVMFAYTTKIPKQNILNGWTIITSNPATCAQVMSFNGNAPALYIGAAFGFSTTGAQVQQAFAVKGTTTYSETSKRVDHGFPINEKIGAKLTISLSDEHEGPLTVYALFEDNTSLLVGSYDPDDGLIFPLTFPVTFPLNQELTYTFDLHFDGLNGQRKRYKDFRVQIISTSLPSIIGWQLDSYIYPARYQGINDAVQASTLTLANPINSQPLLATAINEG
jgi:hypothetical protein